MKQSSRNSSSAKNGVWGLKIPTCMSWDRERLIWIGYEKENVDAAKSPLNDLPKDVIKKICTFLSPSRIMYADAVELASKPIVEKQKSKS